MKSEYAHLELGKDVNLPTRFYTPLKEVRLKHKDRELLYVVGQVVIESSCCGSNSWRYAVVPGYLLSWRKGRDEAGLPTSEVEPITDEETKREIAKIIGETEAIYNIEFW